MHKYKEIHQSLLKSGCIVVTHGHHIFRRGGEEFFFMCTWVKNGYRGGDVFGCYSLGEKGVKGGKKIFDIKENNCLFIN